MGVDWYACDECSETFPDYGHYASCDDCGLMLCGSCAKGKVNMGNAETVKHSGYDKYPRCCGGMVTDEDLLAYALKKLKTTKKKLTKEIQESRRK